MLFLVPLKSLPSTYEFFPGWGGFFLLVESKRSIFIKNELTSWSQEKVIHLRAKVPILAIFDFLCPPSKSFFPNYRQNFKKSFVFFPGEMLGILCFLGFLSSKGYGGALAVLQVDVLRTPYSVTFGSCIFVGRPFVACDA